MTRGGGLPALVRYRAGGAILLLVLVVALALSLVSTALLRGGAAHLRLVANAVHREEAWYLAQAVVEQATAAVADFPADTPAGYTLCSPGQMTVDCDENALPPATVAAGGDLAIHYRITRRGALPASALPVDDTAASSQAPLFEIEATVDGSAAKRGRVRLVRGVALWLPAAGAGLGETGETGETGATDEAGTPGQPPQLFNIYWREPEADPL